jgi:CrcB protein
VTRLLWIGLGGALGTMSRYLIDGWAQRLMGTAFPYGTVAINVVGSFLLVVLMHVGMTKGLIAADLRVVLGAGVLGGFTTYSAFNYESIRLFQQGSMLLGALNIGVTVIGCLLAGALGLGVARWLVGG